MGGQKELYTQMLTGSYEKKDGLEYNGKEYKDYGDNNGYVKYSLIDCPLCGEKILKKYEKDETPGFRSSDTYIEDKICECDLKTYYKENNIYIFVNC